MLLIFTLSGFATISTSVANPLRLEDFDGSCDLPSSHLSLLQRHARLTKHSAADVSEALTSTGKINATVVKVVPGTLGCRYYSETTHSAGAPFDYWAPTSNATGVHIRPEASASGLCYFPGAACASGACCGATKETANNFNHWSNWNQWLCFGVWMAGSVFQSRGQSPEPAAEIQASSPSDQVLPRQGEGQAQVSPFGAPQPSFWSRILNVGAMSVGITAAIVVSIYMAESAQTTLSVLERNSMLAADAWLTPIGSVFQFLEDAMTVKISFAMATGSMRRVKALVMVGVVGGLACGVIAAGLLTMVSYTRLLEVLLVPYSTTGTGCALIPIASEITSASRGYWLLISWCFPFRFITLALTGFILGSLEFGVYGAAMGLSQIVLASIWFGLKPADGASPGLNLLGWANLCSSATFVIVCLLGIFTNPTMVEKYQLTFSSFLGYENQEAVGAPDKETNTEEEQESLCDLFLSVGKESASDGGSAMVLDLCVQLSLAIGVYLSGTIGADTLYQVSAMQSAMPMFGTAYAIGLSYTMKIRGGVLVGRGQYQEFATFLKNNTLIAIYFAVVTVATTWPARSALALYFASPACVYASEPSCLSTYSGIFGGGAASSGTTLQESFGVFSFAAAGICLFTALKAGLYCCFDFAFMAKGGILSFILFVPCIIIAYHYFHTSVAMYAAMFAPTLVLGMAFAVRLFQNKNAMLSNTWAPASMVGQSAN